MKVQDRILQRKIGAFEILLALSALEVLIGTRPRAIILIALTVGFYFAKREFKGEFSLLDIFGLFNKPTKPTDAAATEAKETTK